MTHRADPPSRDTAPDHVPAEPNNPYRLTPDEQATAQRITAAVLKQVERSRR